MSAYAASAQAPRVKVAPKEMRWGVDQPADIIIPKTLPWVCGGFQDIVEYIETELPNVNSTRFCRVALEGSHYQYFYTPHNKRICWRDKAAYDGLYVWQNRRRLAAETPAKAGLWSRIAVAIGL